MLNADASIIRRQFVANKMTVFETHFIDNSDLPFARHHQRRPSGEVWTTGEHDRFRQRHQTDRAHGIPPAVRRCFAGPSVG